MSMRRALPLALAVTLAVAACGSGDDDTVADEGTDEPTDAPATTGGAGGEALYEYAGAVLESPDHGAELCSGAMAMSFPPQCSGIPTAGWSWEGVPGVQSEAGTTWADVHVVGTWDGTTFTPTEAPEAIAADGWRSGQDDAAAADFGPVCEGAEVVEAARTTDADFIAATGAVEGLENVAATWVSDGGAPPAEWTLNVVVTGDAAGAEAAARPLWGGKLCVAERDQPTADELAAAQEQVPELLGEGNVVATTPDQLTGTLVVTAVAPTDEMQATLDDEFGEGVVRLVSVLRPVTG